jgi:ssDNA-specific exonuclease RecJ
MSGCSSDNKTGAPQKINVLDSDFTLKYEIKFSSPTSTGISNQIYYWTEDINQNKQVEVLENIPPSTSTWSKIINAKLKVRPYKMGFRANGLIYITGYGNATCNAYVNDRLTVSQTTDNANAYHGIPVNFQSASYSIYFN